MYFRLEIVDCAANATPSGKFTPGKTTLFEPIKTCFAICILSIILPTLKLNGIVGKSKDGEI